MATLTKQYLDKEGLNALWRKIDDTFSPRSLAYRPTVLGGDATSLTIQFKNANDEQTNIVLPLVNSVDNMKPHAGLMSPSDKTKLDSLDSTAENAVTLKNILVGGGDDNVNPVKLVVNTTQTDINKDDYKAVAFGLSYNADSDLLSIVDLNTQVKDSNGNITTPATAQIVNKVSFGRPANSIKPIMTAIIKLAHKNPIIRLLLTLFLRLI
jgi:hypothetical protein